MSASAHAGGLGWGAIARIGLVQAAIGAMVVLMTSTLNRIMVVELHLAASVPGVLLGLHYVLQSLRPRWGYGAQAGGRRTRWILAGMAMLAIGGTLAAVAVDVLRASFGGGMTLAVIGFAVLGIGVGMAGTALLTLLADRVQPERRAAAAAVTWIMMIAGFVVTTIVASIVLSPFSFPRLIALVAGVGLAGIAITALALPGLDAPAPAATPLRRPAVPFAEALRTVWTDPAARGFTWFIFVAMLAYSAQDLILEPFAGIAFSLTPGQTTALTSLQNGGTLAGMVATALVGRRLAGDRAMRWATVAGCLGSALALVLIALAGTGGVAALIRPAIVALGLANGVFAIAAIGLMMALAGQGGAAQDGAGQGENTGVRMGVWGAAQAIAFGGGGFAGAAAADLARWATGATIPGYALVFATEAGLFVLAAAMMVRRTPRQIPMLAAAE